MMLLPAGARERREPRRGISDEAAKRLTAQLDEFARAEQERRAEEAKALAVKVDEAVARERSQLVDALRRQRGYGALNRALESSISAVVEQLRRGSLFARRAELQQIVSELDRGHQATLLQAWRDARLDPARVAEGVLAQAKPTAGQRIQTLRSATLVLTGSAAEDAPAEPPAAGPLEFTAPFEDSYTELSAAGIPPGELPRPVAAADAATGEVESVGMSGLSLVGSQAYAAMQCSVTVPSGYTRLRVTARAKLQWVYIAIQGGLPTGAAAEMYVDLAGLPTGPAHWGESMMNVLTPVPAWHMLADDREDYVINAVFNIPDTGGEYLIRSGTHVGVWSAVAAFNIAGANGTIDHITVELLD